MREENPVNKVIFGTLLLVIFLLAFLWLGFGKRLLYLTLLMAFQGFLGLAVFFISRKIYDESMDLEGASIAAFLTVPLVTFLTGCIIAYFWGSFGREISGITGILWQGLKYCGCCTTVAGMYILSFDIEKLLDRYSK